MADRLIFPMGFDLESARQDAENRMGDMLKRMNDILKRNPLKIHMALDSNGQNTVYDFFRSSSSIKGINKEMENLRDTWNTLRFDKKFDANGDMTDKAKELVVKFTQLTEAVQRYGMSLEEATRQAKKQLDDEVKAQEKALAATQRRHQQDIDLARRREETETRVANKIREAQAVANDKQSLTVVEQKTNAYNRQAEAVGRLQAKLDQINRILASGSQRLTLEDGTNSELKNRLIQRTIELTRELGSETVKLSKAETDMFNAQKRDAEQFLKTTRDIVNGLAEVMTKLREVKGIGVGFEGAGATTAVSGRLKEFYELSRKLDEIDSKYARLQATGAAENKIGEYTARANALLDERVRITERLAEITKTAEEAQKDRAAKTLAKDQETARQSAEDEQRYQEWMAQKDREVKAAEDAEIRKANATKQIIAKQNAEQRAEEDKRYQEWWSKKEKEIQQTEQTEERKRRAFQQSAHEARSAAAKEAQAAYEMNKALRAQEDVIGNLTAKLRIYQQQIQGQVVGSDAWNRTALEIKRVTEELQRANQQMMDFQQKAFQGLHDSWATRQVQQLAQYREQLRTLDNEFNRLNQAGGAYNADGKLSDRANTVLKDRQQIIKEINRMLTTAADAQLQREKEINVVIKQRQTEDAKIKEARQAELAALRQKRIENDRIRKILSAEENTVKSITAKLQIQQQRLQSTSMDSKKFEKIAKEVERLTKLLEKANEKVRQLTGNKLEVKGVKQTTEHFREQTTYVERLIKRLAVYASFGAIVGFANKIKDITAQFELQRISLGAIIRDQTRANALFSEIKQFALKSPISVMDLTKYTKQVAAYRIETDKLFSTTKMLADVSVGLGVSMDRIVLAFGQTRATGWLRASEIRQFTEAGLPIVELLAENLSKVNGEMVTSAQVMDMVKKRMISFDQVEQVFKDMTSAGGMFYNMQEKQGNSLYGMWAKLGDAASIMYDQIGNTEYVNKGMKNLIKMLTDVMRNWSSWLKAIVSTAIPLATVGAALYAYIAKLKMAELETIKNTAANIAARQELIKKSVVLRGFNALLLKCGVSLNTATAATIAFKTAIKTIGSVGIMALVTAITYGIEKLFQMREEAHRLKDALEDIDTESNIEQMKSVRNFESLAEIAVKAADGSKKQRDALEELKRTYKDIIPEERLSIENLRKMNHEYTSLTNSIKDYVAERMKQKKIDTIIEETGYKMTEAERDISNLMKDTWNFEQIERFMNAYKKVLRDNPKKQAAEAMKEAAEISGVGWDKMLELPALTRDKLAAALRSFSEPFKQQITQIDAVEAAWERGYEALDTYGSGYAKLVEQVQQKPITSVGGIKVEEDDYLAQQQRKNLQIYETLVPTLQRVLSDMGVTWQDGWGYLIKEVSASTPELISAINFDLIDEYLQKNISKLTDYDKKKQVIEGLRKLYDDLAPTDKNVRIIRQRFTEIVQAVTGGIQGMNKYTKYLMTNGQDMEAYVKQLKEQREALANQLKALKATGNVAAKFALSVKNVFAAITGGEVLSIEEMEKQLAVIDKMLGELPSFDKSKKTGGHKEDPRLRNAQEVVSELEKMYNKTVELEKYMSRSDALNKISKQYEGAIAEIEKWASGVGINISGGLYDEKGFIYALKTIKKYIATLPKSEKAVIDIEAKIGDIQFKSFEKRIKDELAQLSSEVSKSKEAKEFFDKIFSQTGDYDMAMNLTVSVYSQMGENLPALMANQLEQILGGGADKNGNVWGIELPTEGIIDYDTFEINAARLKKLVAEMRDEIPEEQRKMLEDVINNNDKLSKNNAQKWAKDLERAKDYSAKRIELARETQEEIRKIESEKKQLDKDSPDYERRAAAYDKMIRSYREREADKTAELDYGFIKDQISMFSELGDDISKSFETILKQLRDYTKSPEFNRLGLDAQKNVYEQINKIEEKLREGFDSISVKTVSSLAGDVMGATIKYVKAQDEVKRATQEAIAADKKYAAALRSGDESLKKAALSEKELAAARLQSATEEYRIATANLQDAQYKASSASDRFEGKLQSVKDAIDSLNNGALMALWNLLGKKGKKSVTDFLTGARRIYKSIDKFREKLAESELTFDDLGNLIGDKLQESLKDIEFDDMDTDAILQTLNEALKQAFAEVGADQGLADALVKTMTPAITNAVKAISEGTMDIGSAVTQIASDAAVAIGKIAEAAGKGSNIWGQIIALILSLLDELADHGLGDFIGELIEKIGEAVEGILSYLITDTIPQLLKSILILIRDVIYGVVNLLTGNIFDLGGGKALKKANKLIEKQKRLVEDLEYSYSRLEDQVDKVFGADYISNYNQRIRALQLQIVAYERMVAAERSKGKKKDGEAIRDYEQTIRDLRDEIKDLNSEIGARMLGTELEESARNFASAWLDAYKEFSNTTSAIKEKMRDMLENLVVESVLAAVMQQALRPVYDLIDNMGEGDFYSTSFWQNVTRQMDTATDNMNAGASNLMTFLEQAGVGLSSASSDLTGISRDIASASEESINGLAAGINTQNFYISQIHANVQGMYALMQGSSSVALTTGGANLSSLIEIQNQHLAQLPNITQNTADTVARLDALVAMLGKVVRPKDATASYVVNTKLI